MTDPFEIPRMRMVLAQLRARGICDERVLDAMNKVPRELFVPPKYRDEAYEDRALPLLAGQTVSQPYMVARACELANLNGEENVLEVGAGSGYQAAVLGALSAQVISIERLPVLVEYARQAIESAGVGNVQIVEGDGSLGWHNEAPYDCIVVAAGAPRVPLALLGQLKDHGRLVIPVGDREMQTLRAFTKDGDEIAGSVAQRCSYVPLLGAEAWHERDV